MTQHKEKAADLLEQIDGNDSKPNQQVKEEPMKTVTNLPVSTDNRIPVEVIPVITADNFAAIAKRFNDYPLPATVAEDDFTTTNVPNFAYLNNYDKITLADGTPTNWYVDTETLTLQIRGFFPCSVVNCVGHTVGDLTDDWKDISHEVLAATLPIAEFGDLDRNEGHMSLHLRSTGPVIGIYSCVDGELRVDQIDDLIAQLEATIAAAKEFRAASELQTGVPYDTGLFEILEEDHLKLKAVD